MDTRSFLVVEDDPAAARYLTLTLEELGTTRTAVGGTDALLAMESSVPDLAILDLRLPDIDGLDLLSMVKQRWPEVPVILVTAADDVATVVEAVHRGAINYLVKPVAPSVLLSACRRALDHTAARLPVMDAGLPEIIGVSKAIVTVRHLVSLAARSDVNVLISGATGSGKELVARAIHRLSGLSQGPFVAQNCSLIPSDLFESQFFGHRRGAFTGAERDLRGLLEESHGGTLFLDELECLTLPHQAKLLRVLDDGEVRAVGSCDIHKVSVRFLAATNRDPAEMVVKGALREDLYYRLRGFEISLPMLRHRREDIPLLATHFLEESGVSLTADALAVLCDLPWPGNVRELRNVVRHAGIVARSGRISLQELGLCLALPQQEDHILSLKNPTLSGVCTLDGVERQAILKALREFKGNQSRAARALGIDRSTLRRKVRKLGIDRITRAS